MTTTCFMVDLKGDEAYWSTPGAMFPVETPRDAGGNVIPPDIFTDAYLAVQRERDPVMVVLPDGSWWCMDYRASNDVLGWQITGTPPKITAQGSILSPGYHGFLTDGVLSDDLEGRTYPDKEQCP